MKLESQELVEEFYEKNKDKFPDLSFEQVKEICYAPFIQTRRAIESGEFPTIRLKFFGTFVAYPKRVKAILVQYEKMFKEHKITPQNYFKKKEQLEKYLDKQV